jgi:hypothetical protein
MRARRLCHRPRVTPEQPGEEWDPPRSDTRILGAEEPSGVLSDACRAGEQGSSGDDAGRDAPRSQRREEGSRIGWRGDGGMEVLGMSHAAEAVSTPQGEA